MVFFFFFSREEDGKGKKREKRERRAKGKEKMVLSNGGNGVLSTSHSLRLRGLPYQADEKDVEAFFDGFSLVKTVVVRKNGKPTGEGYAYFHTEQEASEALLRKNRESMGSRYIELFADNKSSYGSSLNGGRNGTSTGHLSGGGGERKATTSAGTNGGVGARGGGGGGGGHVYGGSGSDVHASVAAVAATVSVPVTTSVHHSPLHSGMTYAQASKASKEGHLSQQRAHVQETTTTTTAVNAVGSASSAAAAAAAAAGYLYTNGNGAVGHLGGQQHPQHQVVDFSPTVSEANSSLSSTPGSASNGSVGVRSAAGMNMSMGMNGNNANSSALRPVVVRVRGLPFSAQERDVRGFFEGLSVKDIVFTLTQNGRPTGEAFVEFMENVLMQNVLAFQKQMLGKRYIEIFKASKQELVEAARSLPGYHKMHFSQGQQGQQAQYSAKMNSSSSQGAAHAGVPGGLNANKCKHVNNITGKTRMLSNAPKGTVLKLRGLPYTTEESDIRMFFSDYRVLGVVLMTRPEREGRLGTCNGVAYVQFSSSQEAESARQRKHKEMMGNRYIECMTHIPKGTAQGGQQEGLVAVQDEPPQGLGGPGGYQQQQSQASAPSDFFRMPHYYGGGGDMNGQVWSMPSGGSLQQQLEKMGLSEKGESLFSEPPSLLGKAMQQGGGAAPSAPPGYGSISSSPPPEAPLAFASQGGWSSAAGNFQNFSLW